jgi:NADH-quinone oxidoreductase subunit C
MIPFLDKLHTGFLALIPEEAPPVQTAAGALPAAVAGAPGAVGATVGGTTVPPSDALIAPIAAPPAVAAATGPQPSVSACQIVNAATKGYHLDVKVGPEQVVAAAELLDREGFAIDTVTGVDWIALNEMEVVYDFFHPRETLQVVVRTRVPRANPEVPTISRVFPGANWHERETHEFFGIKFLGHPNLTPFLLPEDATYHPLRKDFVNA